VITLTNSQTYNALSAALIADLLEPGRNMNAAGAKVEVFRAASGLKVSSAGHDGSASCRMKRSSQCLVSPSGLAPFRSLVASAAAIAKIAANVSHPLASARFCSSLDCSAMYAAAPLSCSGITTPISRQMYRRLFMALPIERLVRI
jgi:hypothetical protein